jgi:hypothetical protein
LLSDLYAIQSPHNAKEDIIVVNSYSMDKCSLQPVVGDHNATKTTVYSTLRDDEAQVLLNTTKNTAITKESSFNKYIENKSPTIKVGINQLINKLREQVTHKSSRQKDMKAYCTERTRNTKITKEIDTLIHHNKERITKLKKQINSDTDRAQANHTTTH